MNYKLIQFILQELKNNGGDRERFNALSKIYFSGIDWHYPSHYLNSYTDKFTDLFEHEQEHIIRTALSRTNGKAVLSVLEGYFIYFPPLGGIGSGEGHYEIVHDMADFSEYRDHNIITEMLYQTFDTPLRNGSTLQEALEACENYFEEVQGVIKLKI